jgi:release factor glutamine methyltransferase
VRDRFREAGIDTADLDARLLAQRAFGLEPIKLMSREREPAPPQGFAQLLALADKRLAGWPVARLLGEKEFWGFPMTLSQATLVPRPETEMLVAQGLILMQGREGQRILDLGTGSGAIAIALLNELPKAAAMATDVSPKALEIARENANRHGVANRMTFRQGDWWEAVPDNETFDLIVSNPPYIATAAIEALAPEVKAHDPIAALDGGMDGLEAYRRILGTARRRLRPGGAIAVEIGSTQGTLVHRMMGVAGFSRVELLQDLQGLDRVVVATHS